jgi:hypothetical protein
LYFAAGASAVDLNRGLDRALKVAESVEAEALATLVVNRLRGILDCVAVKAPSRRRQGAVMAPSWRRATATGTAPCWRTWRSSAGEERRQRGGHAAAH